MAVGVSVLMRKLLSALLVFLLACPSVFAANPAGAPGKKTQPPAALSEHARVVHALQRLTFGPRPGDIERVQAMGLDHWIDQQLSPSQIPNSALDGRLAQYRTLRMSPRELAQAFPTNQMVREAAEGKRAMPSDPTQYGLWEVLVDRYKEQQKNNGKAIAGVALPVDPADQKATEQQSKDTARHIAETLLALPKANRMSTLMRLPISDRRAMVQYAPQDLRDKLVVDFSPTEREAYFAMNNPNAVVVAELQMAKIQRVAYSERQLEEVMTDFWFNHFNVFIYKDQDQYFVTSYERDVIRPNALGKFRDLLTATAKSPAMLYYLDNWASMGPQSQASGYKPGRPANPNTPLKGLNENYGRELMELHTLGVDGGYTQKDVTEVARALTGWTIDKPRAGGSFTFNARIHDPGQKVVLGHVVKAGGGESDGEQVLDILAKHPSTATFIATKLARRFVSDTPPPALVDRAAARFRATDGDLREVVRTILTSPEFLSPDAYHAKVKTPFEFVVSALRTSGTDIADAKPLVRELQQLGMPLYMCQPPTGYKDTADAWVNTGALVSRMNFSLKLARNDQDLALTLGSPEFQR